MIDHKTIFDCTPIIVGIVGFKESGKSYLGNYLQESYGFNRMYFSQGIKDISLKFFNLVMAKDGITHNTSLNKKYLDLVQNQATYHQVFTEVLNYLNIKKSVNDIEFYILNDLKNILINYYTVDTDDKRNEYARKFWQYFGTEFGKTLDSSMWINYIDRIISKKIESLENRIVIDDVRFRDEFDYIKSIREKYKINSYLIGIYNDKSKIKEKTKGFKRHKSEIEIPSLISICDKKITNNYDSKFLDDIDTLITSLILK